MVVKDAAIRGRSDGHGREVKERNDGIQVCPLPWFPFSWLPLRPVTVLLTDVFCETTTNGELSESWYANFSLMCKSSLVKTHMLGKDTYAWLTTAI